MDKEFQVTISDALRKNYYGKDVACQTEISEIVCVKQFQMQIQKLQMEQKALMREMHETKKSLTTGYERRLNQESNRLYDKILEELKDSDREYREKVKIIRHSTRQQMSNALASYLKISNTSNNSVTFVENNDRNAEDVVSIVKKDYEIGNLKSKNFYVENQLKEMLNANDELKHQCSILRNSLKQMTNTGDVPTRSRSTNTSLPPVKTNSPLKEKIVNLTQSERDEYSREISRLSAKIQWLETRLTAANEANDGLERTMTDMSHKSKQRSMEMNEMRANYQRIINEKEAEVYSLNMLIETLNFEVLRLKSDQEAAIEEKKAESEMKDKVKSLNTKLQYVYKEKQEAENEAKKQQKDIENQKLQFKEDAEQLKSEINRLKIELETNDKMWSKKFNVIQSSYHAYREEIHLRNSIQRARQPPPPPIPERK